MNRAVRRIAGGVAIAAICAGLGAGCDARQVPDPLALSDAGIGAITKDTPFEPDIIADLFPNLLIEPGEIVSQGEPIAAIRVIEGDQVLFTMVSGPGRLTIARIEIASPFIALDNGATIGDLFEGLMAPSIVSDIAPPVCDRGRDELGALVICGAPDHGYIYYLFDGSWIGPDDAVPPRAVLNDWTLTQIFWVP